MFVRNVKVIPPWHIAVTVYVYFQSNTFTNRTPAPMSLIVQGTLAYKIGWDLINTGQEVWYSLMMSTLLYI